jgi:HD superfamily phosphohydrolase
MPNWGFTTASRKTRPYGLDPWWLEPAKVITDPIQGDVFTTRLEQLMLDTPPLQRLRGVRQLGTTHLVYPGATHTRLAHSIGSVNVVQMLLDQAIDQGNQNHPVPDLFLQWEEQAKIKAEDPNSLPSDIKELAVDERDAPWRVIYRRRLAEATVLARLGALLHDIGHLPFGHTIEDDLKLLVPHDVGRVRLIRLWEEAMRSWARQLDDRAEQDPRFPVAERLDNLTHLAPGGRLFEELSWLILSNHPDSDGQKLSSADQILYPFVADMVGNTICADLLDYLQRDHVFTGLPVSLGKRYLSSFYVTPAQSGGLYSERMTLRISRNGRERRDISTEILKHLRYRYELQERVLVHHTKLAADAMVGKLFELWLDAFEAHLRDDGEALSELVRRVPADFEVPGASEGGSTAARAARFHLEDLLLTHGDDGVLERLREQGNISVPASELAGALLERRLYKPAANASDAVAADDLHARFGSHDVRRELEEKAAEHAAIAESWHVVVWIPDPRMRLKLAELLVDDEKGVAKFKDKSRLGQDIYEAHRKLWTISVFVHPSVSPTQRVDVLAKMGQLLGVFWDSHAKELGTDPSVGPRHLAAARALGFPEREAKVRRLVLESQSGELAARGESSTQMQLDNDMISLAHSLGLISADDPDDEGPRPGLG